MFDSNPNLKKNFEAIQWDIDKVLKKYKLVDDVELVITESSFIKRSLKSKTIRSLRDTLDECLPFERKIITKVHVLAAKTLLKLNFYQETAAAVLVEVITNKKYSPDSSQEKKTPSDENKTSSDEKNAEYLRELQELAIAALGEISELDKITPPVTNFMDCECKGGIYTCTDPNTNEVVTYGPC